MAFVQIFVGKPLPFLRHTPSDVNILLYKNKLVNDIQNVIYDVEQCEALSRKDKKTGNILKVIGNF